jgi:hypothetical protein
MEPTSLKKADPLQILLIVLQFLALLGLVWGLVFAPRSSFNFLISSVFFMGLSLLYSGIKTVYQARKQQQRFFLV